METDRHRIFICSSATCARSSADEAGGRGAKECVEDQGVTYYMCRRRPRRPPTENDHGGRRPSENKGVGSWQHLPDRLARCARVCCGEETVKRLHVEIGSAKKG
eukprot:1475118-Amphidinium_carterae.1